MLRISEFRRNPASLKGFTLIETIATLVVVLVLTVTMFWVLIAGKTMWQASVIRSSNRQELQIANRKIEIDLKDSGADMITNNTTSTPRAFSFLSAFNADGQFVTDTSGAPSWQKVIIYYIPSGKTTLLRKEVYGSYTGPITTTQLNTFCDGKGNQVAGSVTAMNLVPNVGNNSAALTLTVQKKNQQGNNDQQTLTSTIFMRN